MEESKEKRVIEDLGELSKYLYCSLRTVGQCLNRGMPVNEDGDFDLDVIDTWIEERKNKVLRELEPGEEIEFKPLWNASYTEFRGKPEKLIIREHLKGELIFKMVIIDLLEAKFKDLKRAIMES